MLGVRVEDRRETTSAIYPGAKYGVEVRKQRFEHYELTEFICSLEVNKGSDLQPDPSEDTT
jgi:hypothetical protein